MISVRISAPGDALAPDWDDFTQRASANVFLDPAALKAAHDTGFAAIHVLTAWDQENGAARKLVGVWALQVRKLAFFWPALLEALPFNYAFLSSPMVDPAFVDAVIPAFLAAVKSARTLPNVISVQDLDSEQASYPAMLKSLAGKGGTARELSQAARPIVTRAFGVKTSGSTRKKLRQDFNRLSTLGTVEVTNDRAPVDVAAAFEAFLALEIKSWKGDNGTALLSDPQDAAFVRRLSAALAAEGRCSVALLRLDGKPIAAQVLMYCGATAYTWKTAYDADYGKYSPGALLIDKVTQELFATPGIDTIDSCSAEGSFMASLWAGRRRMVDLLVDVGDGASLAFRLESARQSGYRWLRDVRNTLRDRIRNRRKPRPASRAAAADSVATRTNAPEQAPLCAESTSLAPGLSDQQNARKRKASIRG